MTDPLGLDLPPPRKSITFKLSKAARADIIVLRVELAKFVGQEEPLNTSETIRACLRLVVERLADYNKAIYRKRAAEGIMDK